MQCVETRYNWLLDELQNIQIKFVTINQIKLREPLEMQTIQPKKYLKCYAND